jgi:hypothetical protein
MVPVFYTTDILDKSKIHFRLIALFLQMVIIIEGMVLE